MLRAPNVQEAVAAQGGEIAGFWLGLWHGIIAPITFVISLFSDNVNGHEIHNNSNGFNFRFVLGAGVLLGGGGGAGSRVEAEPSLRAQFAGPGTNKTSVIQTGRCTRPLGAEWGSTRTFDVPEAAVAAPRREACVTSAASLGWPHHVEPPTRGEYAGWLDRHLGVAGAASARTVRLEDFCADR